MHGEMNKLLRKCENKNDTKRIVIYILESESVTLKFFHNLTSQTSFTFELLQIFN